MNRDAIAVVANLVGTFGVIITLIYLAIQVRSNTRVTSAQSRHTLSDFVLRIAIFGQRTPIGWPGLRAEESDRRGLGHDRKTFRSSVGAPYKTRAGCLFPYDDFLRPLSGWQRDKPCHLE